jgi:hypothetical protein
MGTEGGIYDVVVREEHYEGNLLELLSFFLNFTLSKTCRFVSALVDVISLIIYYLPLSVKINTDIKD